MQREYRKEKRVPEPFRRHAGEIQARDELLDVCTAHFSLKTFDECASAFLATAPRRIQPHIAAPGIRFFESTVVFRVEDARMNDPIIPVFRSCRIGIDAAHDGSRQANPPLGCVPFVRE